MPTGESPAVADEVRIRTGRTGDLGWIFHRQAVVYEQEYGFTPVFEAYVAKGLAPFLARFGRDRDRLWIAEGGDGPVGSIAAQHDPERPGWAQLRWFLVEPAARGQGLGTRLLDGAVAFCRQAGYQGIHLWTVDDLHAAARAYERAGFRLARTLDGCPWSDGNEQQWELLL